MGWMDKRRNQEIKWVGILYVEVSGLCIYVR
jgi:hypothetical protein